MTIPQPHSTSVGELHWPDDLRPEDCPVYTQDQIEIAAPPTVVWAWLVRAELWPTWYPNSRDVRFVSAPGPDLAAGTEFTWKTFGVRVRTIVQEFEPAVRLAWRGSGLGAAGYHGWIVEPRARGCRVITEETQQGLVPRVARRWLQRALQREHQNWLEGLARMAEGGPPP